jgi:CheY-like chemotaxis protein
MAPAQAFMSYTRRDDDFFGGRITSFRSALEKGIQVVTGDRSFEIFQDVEGIELGQKWQKRLDEAISGSLFLVPIITPLFFESAPCRDELQKFIEHENGLGRDDLILPIYFVKSPKLEKDEELEDDSLAREIAGRQRFDWRAYRSLPTEDPKFTEAVLDLAENVERALARTASRTPVTVNERRDQGETDEVLEVVRTMESREEPTIARQLVLWVDDRPDNNIIERQSMAAYNFDFELAASTGQALAKLQNRRYDAIISDMGRPPDSQAGYTLLEAVRESGNQTPYFIYAGSRAASHVQEALRRGAQGTTNRSDELLQMLLEA